MEIRWIKEEETQQLIHQFYQLIHRFEEQGQLREEG